MADGSPERNRNRRREVSGGEHHRRTEERLVLGGFAILLVVGGLLTLLLLGKGPATVAIGVLQLVVALLLILYKGLDLLERWLREQ